jgi:hypothetical protein
MGASVLSYAVYATVVAMRKTMQYRMYPTAPQQHLLDETLDTCSLVYNHMEPAVICTFSERAEG